MSPTDENSSRTTSIVAESRRLAAAGDLDGAITFLERTIRKAEDAGDRELADMAICTRGGFLIATHRGDDAVGELRQILLRSSSPSNTFRAAYQIANYHDLRQERERSHFYARLALDHARMAGKQDCICSSYNLIANNQMLDSRFVDACSNYEHALELMPRATSLEAALIRSNLGYCKAVLGDSKAAFEALFAALRAIRTCGDPTWLRFPHLGLSYSYLEIGRAFRAQRHASRALELSFLAENAEQIKNSLYLLGESEMQLGNEDRALEHFASLQESFYPDQPGIVDILAAADIRQLINIMA